MWTTSDHSECPAMVVARIGAGRPTRTDGSSPLLVHISAGMRPRAGDPAPTRPRWDKISISRARSSRRRTFLTDAGVQPCRIGRRRKLPFAMTNIGAVLLACLAIIPLARSPERLQRYRRRRRRPAQAFRNQRAPRLKRNPHCDLSMVRVRLLPARGCGVDHPIQLGRRYYRPGCHPLPKGGSLSTPRRPNGQPTPHPA